MPGMIAHSDAVPVAQIPADETQSPGSPCPRIGLPPIIGNGQSLVIGNSASQLEAFSDPNNVSRTNVGIAGVSNPTDIGRFLSGGELGAALQFRNSVLLIVPC